MTLQICDADGCDVIMTRVVQHGACDCQADNATAPKDCRDPPAPADAHLHATRWIGLVHFDLVHRGNSSETWSRADCFSVMVNGHLRQATQPA